MRRNLSYLIFTLVIFYLLSIVGCSETATVDKIVDSYYKSYQPSNKGDLKILVQKPMEDKTLVLAKKYCGEGHLFTNLFIIDSNNKVEKCAQGFTPMSMCFSANLVKYRNITIVYGTFNNTKWDIKTDIKIPVEIDNIVVRFKNGETIKEKVNVQNGYIVYSSNEYDLDSIELYNNVGQLQSDLNEIGDGKAENQEFTDVN